MFVSDDPPESVVRRAAAVFLRSNGSIAEVVRSSLTSRDFARRRNYDVKLKSPFEYAASAVRSRDSPRVYQEREASKPDSICRSQAGADRSRLAPCRSVFYPFENRLAEVDAVMFAFIRSSRNGSGFH
jgi:uncharacterized protein (DUF1800 family)